MKTNRREFLLTAGGGLGMSALIPPACGLAAEADGGGVGYVVVPQRKHPVLAEADVVVCGGGTAGISAACCASRHGAKVLLLERWPSVGGMATNALVNIWHTSDRTKQVIYGLVQEVVERAGSAVERYDHYPVYPETHEFEPCRSICSVGEMMV